MKFCPQCARALEEQTIDGAERKVCVSPDCNFVQWNNPVPVVAALVEHEGEYILARNARWPQGMFSLITGYLEAGETPEQAVARETKEELGLDAEAVEFIGHYNFSAKNQLLIAYAVRVTGEVKLNHELAEVKRFTTKALQGHNFGPMVITERMVNDFLSEQRRLP
ncbi:MAG: hypothetical protein BMS9Abin36_1189 [Gammaproteobacteria bacterium]|nr:MAG: hypothetical protein BMS9Abin36_1189 [Gammaproteobacteria bacterium]